MIRLLRIIAVAIAMTAIAFAAAPHVNLDIKYVNGTAPFYTRARVTIDKHPDNRWLCVQWTQIQGGASQRTSCQPHIGEGAPLTVWQEIKSLSSGKWDVVAYVVRSDEQGHLSNRVTLRVFGPNYEPDPIE
jgi:hypothetical protein